MAPPPPEPGPFVLIIQQGRDSFCRSALVPTTDWDALNLDQELRKKRLPLAFLVGLLMCGHHPCLQPSYWRGGMWGALEQHVQREPLPVVSNVRQVYHISWQQLSGRLPLCGRCGLNLLPHGCRALCMDCREEVDCCCVM
jgi:hypothetical protein